MNLWKKTEEKLAYDGYRKVLRRTFTLPDEQSVEFDVIHSGEAVAIMAITADKKVVCFRQFRPGPEKVLCELPGGAVEKKETLEEAAARELQEETGYTANLEYLGWYPTSAYEAGKRHMFVGIDARATRSQDLDSTEHGKVELLSLNKFKNELFAGNMTDTTLGYAGLHHLSLL